jgi:hypothetical protein
MVRVPVSQQNARQVMDIAADPPKPVREFRGREAGINQDLALGGSDKDGIPAAATG